MRVAIISVVLLGTMSVAGAGRRGGWGDGARDHRDRDSGSSSSGGRVRDHRSSSSGSGSSSSGGTGRDHRGSDSDSSSSDSSSSDSSADSSVSISSTSNDEVRAPCLETSDVVGHRKCSRFGRWARATRIPNLVVEVGTHVRQFVSERGVRAARLEYGSGALAMTPVDAGRDVVSTGVLRFGVGARRGIYVLGELELGDVIVAGSSEMRASRSSAEQHTGIVGGALAIGGVRLHSKHGALGIEAAGGARFVEYRFVGPERIGGVADINVAIPVFEARARGEVFVSPWCTLGAVVGANVLARGDWMAGAFLGLHTRAFAGGR